MSQPSPIRTTFAGWMGSMWLYTVLRFALFFALWGIVVLLARPRAAFARQLEARVDARRQARVELDSQLDEKDASSD